MTSNVRSKRQRGAESWLRFAGAVTVLLIVAVGIPAGLVAASRLGLGSAMPVPRHGSWEGIRSWATTQRSSSELARVALRTLISLCWVLWAALLISLLSSIIETRPRLGRLRVPRVGLFDGLGAWLVAGLTALSSFGPNVARAQPIAPRLPVAAAVAGPAPVGAAPSAATQASTARSPRAGWATVQPAESIEMFSARTLGSAQRWPEVFALNQGRDMPDGSTFSQPWRLSAGWELQLPSTPAPTSPVDVADGGNASPAREGYRPAEQITVVAGDNLWNLASARLRSIDAPHSDADVARLVRETVELNPAIDDPSVIRVGQPVTMPAVAATPRDVAAAASTAADDQPSVTSPQAGWPTHTVVRGDTLWDILEAHYGYVDAPLVHRVAAENDLADPDNIPIGTIIRLPPLVEPAAPSPSDGASGATAAPSPSAPEISQPPPPAASPTSRTLPEPNGPAATLPAPRTIAPTSAPAVASATPPPLTAVPSAPADGEVTGPSGSPLPWAVAGAASAGLATGLLELWRRRRRARWSSGRSPWNIGAASEPLPDELVDQADLSTIERVSAALTQLSTTVDDPADLRSVEFDAEELIVRWGTSRPVAFEPWSANVDGLSWQLSPSARLAPPVRRVGFPGLVTFGVRDSRQYMVNLAAVGTMAVDGPGAEAFVGSLALELGSGELLSDAIVHLHSVGLVAGEQLDRVISDFDDPPDASPMVHVSIVESDDPAVDGLVAAATGDPRRVVLLLGVSERAVGLEVRVQADGAAVESPSETQFAASLVPGALRCDEAPPTAAAVDRPAVDNVVHLEPISGGPKPPRAVLRLFSSMLPDLDPRPANVDVRAMTIIAALDYLGTGHPPQRLAELLHVKVKTIQNKLSRLTELQLVHSDGNVWRVDAGVCSDVDWLLSLADAASSAPSRGGAARALSECWELLARITGPAYAAGGGSSLWSWIDERDVDFGGATAAEQATTTLFKAVNVAVATWDSLADDSTDDLLSAERLVDVLLRVESSIRSLEPWPLFEAAGHAVARTGAPAVRQKLATRLAQFVHDTDVEPPERLVNLVTG